jgi:L-histidine N-alpha-methyltransferase
MNYKVLESIKNQEEDELKDQLALDILTGFTSKRKYIPSKYFYDDKGSELFVKITEEKEYYLTRSEENIIENNKEKICSYFLGHKLNVIELGAGDGHKTKLLLDELCRKNIPLEYCPIDISEDAIKGVCNKFGAEKFKTFGIVGEYIPALKWANRNKEGGKLVLFLGSNIGNFSLEDSLVFLRTIWKNLAKDDQVLIGFDLKKDINILLNAYNDRNGVTSQFNLNLLSRINRELGANFVMDNFQHFGTYNAVLGTMESFLISKKPQKIRVDYLEKEFYFDEYEPIHLEYSFKYLNKDIKFLAKETGFEIIENFTDSSGFFVDSLWKVLKD